MSLHYLCRFGLLTRETSLILQNLDKSNKFNNIETKLFESGLTSSKSHAKRIKLEIKKRIDLKEEFLPEIDSLIIMAKTNFNSNIKGQIYFVYLYNIDIFVSHLTDKLGEIFHSNYENLEISRETIKNLLITYLKSISIKAQKKAIDNWIGRYLSIMREINVLVRKKNHDYFINFQAIRPEVWYFFALDSYFNNYSLLKNKFFKAFQIKPTTTPNLLKNLEYENSKINKMIHLKFVNNSVKIETSFSSIQEWIVNV